MEGTAVRGTMDVAGQQRGLVRLIINPLSEKKNFKIFVG